MRHRRLETLNIDQDSTCTDTAAPMISVEAAHDATGNQRRRRGSENARGERTRGCRRVKLLRLFRHIECLFPLFIL